MRLFQSAFRSNNCALLARAVFHKGHGETLQRGDEVAFDKFVVTETGNQSKNLWKVKRRRSITRKVSYRRNYSFGRTVFIESDNMCPSTELKTDFEPF
jgi:hypothetical protein